MQRFAIEVGGYDRAAMRGEEVCYGQAEARGGAGYNGDLVVEASGGRVGEGH
jgi:hypothetical protein